MARRRQLLVLDVTSSGLRTVRQLAAPERVAALAISGDAVCAAAGGQYLVFRVSTGRTQPLFEYDPATVRPLVRSIRQVRVCDGEWERENGSAEMRREGRGCVGTRRATVIVEGYIFPGMCCCCNLDISCNATVLTQCAGGRGSYAAVLVGRTVQQYSLQSWYSLQRGGSSANLTARMSAVFQEEFLVLGPADLAMFALVTGTSQRPPIQLPAGVTHWTYQHPFIITSDGATITLIRSELQVRKCDYTHGHIYQPATLQFSNTISFSLF